MKTQRLGYASHDGASRIHALLWQPGKQTAVPRGIVQIVHGMAEHIERYEPFARYLASCGFVVCANDHVGHGKSAKSEEDLGHIPLEGGADVLIEDVHDLRRLAASRYSSTVPYVLFGHSMGSFVTRSYLTRHGEGIAAAVLCGTGQQSRSLLHLGRMASKLIAAGKGERYRSSFVDSLGAGAFSKAIEGARTDVDWISTDPAVVDEYIADPACGQMFSVGGYASLTSLTLEATDASRAALIPHDVPLLFVAGDKDPVGDCGCGVQRAASEYRDAGIESVDVKLYEGMRHEILNEPGKERVYADVESWLKSKGI
ncbi:MAG: alpha/beta fold hydrolase [Slackia sp.]|nr:alpha/beta fold hydrolase [Slackia sp.]